MADWTLTGAEGLPIHGDTHTPQGEPRAVALLVHGFTGHKDRNIHWGLAHDLADAGLIAHRFTLSHAGVEEDADDITRLDEFQRDSSDFCVHDIRAVADAVAAGAIAGRGLPLVLIGHSRGGATVLRWTGEAEAGAWPMRPAVLICLAATAALTRFDDNKRRALETVGYVSAPCGRGPNGEVRMGPSWYEHHATRPTLFDDAIAAIRCPVLIAHSDTDAAVPIDHADRIEALFHQHNRRVSPRRLTVHGADHNFDVLGYRPGEAICRNPRALEVYGAIRGLIDETLGAG